VSTQFNRSADAAREFADITVVSRSVLTGSIIDFDLLTH
jgi:hypothetical protein